MSRGHLLVSEASAEIHDTHELGFVVMGEILQEQIPPLRREPGGMIEPGVWRFEIEGDFNKVQKYFEEGKRVFRVVREDGSTDSTDGFICRLLPSLRNSNILEVDIKASGERISKPASLPS